MNYAGHYERLYADRQHVPLWGAGPGRLVARIGEWCTGGEVLDLGCGDGKNALFLEKLGFAVTGVEISSEALELLQDRFDAVGHVPKGGYLQVDLESWLPDQRYDVLVSYGVYHCLSSHDRLGRHRLFQEAVRPGGVILFCSITDGLPMPDDHLTPGICLPSHDEIAQLWDGYEVLEMAVGELIESHPPTVPVHRHEASWIVARVA